MRAAVAAGKRLYQGGKQQGAAARHPPSQADACTHARTHALSHRCTDGRTRARAHTHTDTRTGAMKWGVPAMLRSTLESAPAMVPMR